MTASPMRVRLEGYARAHASLRRRATALAVLALVAGLVALFFGMGLAVATGTTPKEIGADREQYIFLVAFLAFVTALLAAITGLLLWRWRAGRARLRRLRALSALARRQAVSSSDDVARSLQLDAAAAEGLLRDAAALGVVEAPPPLALAATAPALPLPSPAPLGAVLNGTYQLDAHLGRGAMGAVYAAHHLRTGRAYAVKMILPGGRAPADMARRFEREATAAGGLGHPNIVGVHDLDATPEGLRYLVMDLLRGETLEQRLAREGSLPFAEARRIGLEIASALEAAHAAGLLHRDVKPANVFLAADPGCAPRAVLLDFGLVKRLDEAAASRLTATGAVVGTPLYMAPEQARGEPLDPRSDLYGLSALLFEMVTGAPPFLDRTLAAVYARLLHESAPRAGSLCPVPPAFDALLARGLAKRREDRFPDAAAFAAALASIPP
jgi:hypothetical protein